MMRLHVTIPLVVVVVATMILLRSALALQPTADPECVPLPCLEHMHEVSRLDAGDCHLLFISHCLMNATTDEKRTRFCCSDGHENHSTACVAAGGACTLLDKEGGQVCERGTVLNADCGPNPATCCSTRALCELELCPQGYEDEIVPDVEGETPRACPPDGTHPLSIHCYDNDGMTKVERECCPLPKVSPPPPPPGETRDSPCALAGGHGTCVVDHACDYGVIHAKDGEEPLCDGKPSPDEDCCAAIDFCGMPACPEGTVLASGLVCEGELVPLEGDHCAFLGRRVQQTCCRGTVHSESSSSSPPSPTGQNNNTNAGPPVLSSGGDLLWWLPWATIGASALAMSVGGLVAWRVYRWHRRRYERVDAGGELLSSNDIDMSDFEDDNSGSDDAHRQDSKMD